MLLVDCTSLPWKHVNVRMAGGQPGGATRAAAKSGVHVALPGALVHLKHRLGRRCHKEPQ